MLYSMGTHTLRDMVYLIFQQIPWCSLLWCSSASLIYRFFLGCQCTFGTSKARDLKINVQQRCPVSCYIVLEVLSEVQAQLSEVEAELELQAHNLAGVAGDYFKR